MDIAESKYVSLTTFRRDGTAVPVPVWIVRLPDGRVGLTSAATAGKVKRIRNNPAITLRPCDVRGRVAEGAGTTTGNAEVVDGAAYDDVWAAIRKKYKIVAAGLGFWAKLTGLFKRSAGVADCAIIITIG